MILVIDAIRQILKLQKKMVSSIVYVKNAGTNGLNKNDLEIMVLHQVRIQRILSSETKMQSMHYVYYTFHDNRKNVCRFMDPIKKIFFFGRPTLCTEPVESAQLLAARSMDGQASNPILITLLPEVTV